MRAPHEVLGVAPDATPEAVKQAYRRRSMKEHPDRNPGDPGAAERFKELNAAYAALSGKAAPSAADPHGGSAGYADPFSGMWGQEFHIHDLFEQLFAQSSRAQAGAQSVRVSVPWALALSGGSYSVSFKGVPWTVQLPAGVADGDRFQVPAPPGQSGTWIWVLHVVAPEGFQREGNDIHGVLTLPVFRAALGGTHRWALWDGEVALTIPAGIQAGQKLRLPGRGAVHPRNPVRGDLIAHVALSVPEKLTAAQRSALAEWLGDAPPAKPRRRKKP